MQKKLKIIYNLLNFKKFYTLFENKYYYQLILTSLLILLPFLGTLNILNFCSLKILFTLVVQNFLFIFFAYTGKILFPLILKDFTTILNQHKNLILNNWFFYVLIFSILFIFINSFWVSFFSILTFILIFLTFFFFKNRLKDAKIKKSTQDIILNLSNIKDYNIRCQNYLNKEFLMFNLFCYYSRGFLSLIVILLNTPPVIFSDFELNFLVIYFFGCLFLFLFFDLFVICGCLCLIEGTYEKQKLAFALGIIRFLFCLSCGIGDLMLTVSHLGASTLGPAFVAILPKSFCNFAQDLLFATDMGFAYTLQDFIAAELLYDLLNVNCALDFTLFRKTNANLEISPLKVFLYVHTQYPNIKINPKMLEGMTLFLDKVPLTDTEIKLENTLQQYIVEAKNKKN